MANFDIALIVVVSILAAIMIVAMAAFVWFYQHPDEYGQSYFYKAILVIGFSFACYSVLLLPLDVANQGGVSRGLDPIPMDLLWLITYLTEGGIILVLVPFLMYFYEDESPNPIKRFFVAFGWELLFLIICGAFLAIMYAFLGYTDIPVMTLVSPLVPDTTPFNAGCPSCYRVQAEVTIRPTIIVYFIALMSWVGWIFLVVFGGIGLAALPMDLINDFRTRPRTLKNTKEGKEQYIRMRKNLNERAAKLLEEGQQIKQAEETGKAWPRRKVNKWKTKVYELERDFDFFNFYNDNQRSPIWYYFRLALGILSILVSIAWIIHIILYILLRPPVTNFLNGFFIILDSVFPLFGTLAFAIFTFYLVWCVLKGTMKFGLRLLIITIHPLKYRGTLMNGFLFNLGMFTISTYAVMQFCSQAFADYARLTSMANLFGSTARYLRFLKYFFLYNIYIYALLGFWVLALLYLLVCTGRRRREKELDAEFRRMRDAKV